MLLAVENNAGGNQMYGMSGPELLAQLKMRDTLRDALSWVYPGAQKFIYE